MQNLAPANGTEVAAYNATPGGSFLDTFVNDLAAEGHQIADALRAPAPQPAIAEERLDNVPSFAPGGMSGPRR